MSYCICILVSCLCWNDGILVTASWDSTVKVSIYLLKRDNRIVFSSFDGKILG